MTDITQFDLFDLPADDENDVAEKAYQKEALTKQQSEASRTETKETETANFTDSENREVDAFTSQPSVMPEALVQVESVALENPDLILLMAEVIAAKDDFFDAPQKLFRSYKQLLQELVAQRYISYVDLYFAEFLTQQKGFKEASDYLGYSLLALLVSRAYGFGHTALPKEYLYEPHDWFIENDHAHRRQVIEMLLTLSFGLESDMNQDAKSVALKEVWNRVQRHISLPLVMTEDAVYLERNYQQEGVIVELFKSVKEMDLTDAEQQYIRQQLDQYFQSYSGEIDWQKFAAANAILNNISVISGGPGTGKTTTVFKILQTLIDLHHYREVSENPKPFTILLAAPTGKAAARLSESILGQVRQLQTRIENAEIEEQEAVRRQLALIPLVGQTLHRLLVIHPFTRKPRYNRYNPLNFDLLIVDEASMIDQQMLVQLIGALPAHGRVIFLGDKDQLASVEAGAIMHELCVSENYSRVHFDRLNRLLHGVLPENQLVNSQMPAFNYLSFLKKSYRFSENSSLGKLAKIVNNEQGDLLFVQTKAMISLIEEEKRHIEKGEKSSLAYTVLPMEEADLKRLLKQVFKPYVQFLMNGQGIEFADEAFKVFSNLGVLSARRTGLNGALELNELIRKTLFPQEAHREFFHGLPIMITHNSVENNLFNGDIGLILRNEEGQLRAYFEGVDSSRVFSIHALPKFETAFAMTIHKSQGSEFQKILLFLGEEASPFLTKELFYTGITRAKESVHVFANDESIAAALRGRVDRFSFIHQRLSE